MSGQWLRHPALQRVLAPLQRSSRWYARRPILGTFLLLSVILFLATHVFHQREHGRLGRWYYNYALTKTPASLARFIPKGDWDEPKAPPRWIPEIYESTWPGEWELPVLTRPQWRREQEHAPDQLLPASHPHTMSRRLVSPAILKFHVFSASVSERSYAKRALIRKHSPIFQLPPAYRHLIDVKFVMGYDFLDTWGPPLNETMENKIREEEREYGDILRLPGLWRGENLREGKILQWIRDVGQGKDGRPAWYLFKVDEDAVVNLPNFLDLLLSLNPHEPTYLGTSLARWPDYHNHFTGFLSGFNYGLYKTLSEGISKMTTEEIYAAWDDDVLVGELMYSLPPAPHCLANLSPECDPHAVPEYGWTPLPENPDPRTHLYRHDFVRHAGDPAWFGTIGDIAMHGWTFKSLEGWEMEWKRACEGRVWRPPSWMSKYADLDMQ